MRETISCLVVAFIGCLVMAFIVFDPLTCVDWSYVDDMDEEDHDA